MSTTIYAIWEAHDHSWGKWTSNGNGTHTRTCATDSSHTETGSCSGGNIHGEGCLRNLSYGLRRAFAARQNGDRDPAPLRLPAYVGNE